MSATRTENRADVCVHRLAKGAGNLLIQTAHVLTVGPFAWKDVNYTIDPSKIGPGGIMAGYSLTPNSWFEVYDITDPRGNAFEAMLVPSGVAIVNPLGVAHSVRRGSVLTDSAGNIYDFYHHGARWEWNVAGLNLAPFTTVFAPPPGAWTTHSLAGSICPCAQKVSLNITSQSSAAGYVHVYIRQNGSVIPALVVTSAQTWSARGINQLLVSQRIYPVDAAQQIELYATGANSLWLTTLAYYDPHCGAD